VAEEQMKRMQKDVERLTVVIGATQGIGRHIAERAAERGDVVLGCARSRIDLTKLQDEVATSRAGAVIDVIAGDFLSASMNLETVTSRIAAHDGRVSVIISAAAIGPVGPLTRIDIDRWAQAVTANVVGTARLVAAISARLRPADLVVVFSGGGVGGPSPQPNLSAYTTSKAALMHLVEVAARESPDGPVLVAIAPGAFPTAFTDVVLQVDPGLAGAALLADVARTKAGEFDAGPLDALLDHLESADVGWLSGRTLSAKWDGPASLTAAANAGSSSDLYKLRRVDGAAITAAVW
jgi:NAD(P)-dependent dehydrogenase (short-subunit alcohol dehydrogenase family)